MIDPALILPALEAVALLAGDAIMEIYRTGFAVERKDDDSPVTEADRRAEAIILPILAELFPGIPAVAEEEASAGRIPEIGDGPFWLIDPLDGTKEFIKRNGEFTVNIGLVAEGVPRAGVVFAPALSMLWSGAGPGTAGRVGADGVRHPIQARPIPAQAPVVLGSRSHANAEAMAQFLAPLTDPVIEQAGSSIKFCRIAEGVADYYPRFGPTSEWDTAAGHAVLAAAGGRVEAIGAGMLGYGKPGFLNPPFVARGRG